MNLKDYLGVEEAAEFLGISVSTLRRKAWRDLIPFYRSPFGKVLYKKEELQAFLDKIVREQN
jgi:excisionase family DNA binding protein